MRGLRHNAQESARSQGKVQEALMKEHDDAREIEMVGGEDHFVVQVEGQIEDKVTSNEEAKDIEGGRLFGGGHGGGKRRREMGQRQDI